MVKVSKCGLSWSHTHIPPLPVRQRPEKWDIDKRHNRIGAFYCAFTSILSDVLFTILYGDSGVTVLTVQTGINIFLRRNKDTLWSLLGLWKPHETVVDIHCDYSFD